MKSENHKHHPHVLPLSVYLGIGAALFVLTAITVGVSYINLGAVGNLIVAMGVATLKASLVALFFMHLLYDNKLYAIVFTIGLLMLAVFIIQTMFDTMYRDGIYDYRAKPIKGQAEIYKDPRFHSSNIKEHSDNTEKASSH